MLTPDEVKKVFDQVINIWVNPEIERRIKRGWLKEDFRFSRVQIIFTPKQKTKIRFNDEIDVTARVRLKKSVVKGDEINNSDIDSVEKIEVNYPPNSGHITLIRFLDEWIIIFDCKYNKEKIREFIAASKEFYESAKDNLEKGRLRPFFENCWASAELSSACHFLSLGQEYENHQTTLKKFEEWSKLGNVDKKHSEALARLNYLRKSARYLHTKEFEKEDNFYFLNIIKLMLEDTEKLIKLI